MHISSRKQLFSQYIRHIIVIRLQTSSTASSSACGCACGLFCLLRCSLITLVAFFSPALVILWEVPVIRGGQENSASAHWILCSDKPRFEGSTESVDIHSHIQGMPFTVLMLSWDLDYFLPAMGASAGRLPYRLRYCSMAFLSYTKPTSSTTGSLRFKICVPSTHHQTCLLLAMLCSKHANTRHQVFMASRTSATGVWRQQSVQASPLLQ